MNDETIFPIGASLTKNFVALLVVQLHVKGKLSLDDPITTYLPNLRINQLEKGAPPITLRHLLSHTSGIREYRNRHDILRMMKEFAPWPKIGVKRPRSEAAALRDYYCGPAALPVQAVGIPGRQHIKSHHNYGLLALACEEVAAACDANSSRRSSRTGIRSLLRANVFQPLRMTSTDLQVPEGHSRDLTTSFRWAKKEGFLPIPAHGVFDPGQGRPSGVGGLSYSSAQDMGRYLQALVDPAQSANGALSETMLDELLRPSYQKDAFLPAQALSFAVEESFDPVDREVAYVTCGQGMSFAGYQTALIFSRHRGVGAGVLCNAGSDSYELSRVAAMAFQEVSRQASDARAGSVWCETRGDGAGKELPQEGSSRTEQRKREFGVTDQQEDVPVVAQPISTREEPAPCQLRSSSHARPWRQAFGMRAPGFEAAVLWPQVVGVYQLPWKEFSARVMWTLGGEVQVYVEDSRLRMRALWGPLRTRLFNKEKGLVLLPAQDGHPLHFSVEGAGRQVLSTPVRGGTDIAFDVTTGGMTLGMVTLQRTRWYFSLRVWAMGFLAMESLRLIGRGKFVEIMTSLLLWG